MKNSITLKTAMMLSISAALTLSSHAQVKLSKAQAKATKSGGSNVGGANDEYLKNLSPQKTIETAKAVYLNGQVSLANQLFRDTLLNYLKNSDKLSSRVKQISERGILLVDQLSENEQSQAAIYEASVLLFKELSRNETNLVSLVQEFQAAYTFKGSNSKLYPKHSLKSYLISLYHVLETSKLNSNLQSEINLLQDKIERLVISNATSSEGVKAMSEIQSSLGSIVK